VVLFAVFVVVSGCGPADTETEKDESSAWRTDGTWDAPGGRWHLVDGSGLTAEQRSEFERLESIGYLAGSTAAPVVSGVTVHDTLRACDGINLFVSGHEPGAFLMDMEGDLLYAWRYSFMDAWRAGPGGELPKSSKGSGFWRRVHLYDNGDLLAVFDGHALIKIDAHSRLLWAKFGGFHHDMDVMEDGRIYTLLREPRIIPRIDPEHPVLEEFVVILDENGNELERVSQLEAIERSGRLDLLEGMKEHGDIFHTNTIEVLDGSLADRIPGFEAGNVLISIRELDNIAVIDMDDGIVVWGLEGPWLKQHQPEVLPNGNMLIFDNGGSREQSRILEFNPATLEIVWVYKGDEENTFHSATCGSQQRLPNGNTLISETDRGRAFEVTRGGEIVWEFVSPARAGEDGSYIASLFEMLRLPSSSVEGWLVVE